MMDYDRGLLSRDEEPDEGGGSVQGECVLVPKGEYELRYINYETANYFGSPRVVVHFAIVSPEGYAGLPLERFYNVLRLTSPPGRFGNFVARGRSDLTREFREIVGSTGRRDRISFTRFKDQRIVAQIETVKFDYKRNPLSAGEQYSRIKRLVSVLPSDDW